MSNQWKTPVLLVSLIVVLVAAIASVTYTEQGLNAPSTSNSATSSTRSEEVVSTTTQVKSVTSSANVTPNNPQVNQNVSQGGGGLAPREPTIAEGLYIVSLEDTMSRNLNFTLRTPSNIPRDYSLQGVILFDMDPLAPEKDKQAFNPIRIGLLYSTHPLETDLTLSEFRSKYSIILVTEGYGSGGNATNPYAGNAGNATYLWKYPSLVRPSYVIVFKFDEHTFYQVTAEKLTPEQRLAIANSLIARP